VGVQVLVERDAPAIAGHHLDRAGYRVAPEQQVAAAGELSGLDRIAVGESDFGTRGDVETGFDDAVVAQRDAQPGIRPEQAVLADRDHLGATAGQRAHDRGAAADVRAVADHDTRPDAAL